MSTGCGRPTKGSHKDDDAIPCGTNLWHGKQGEQAQTVLLCDKCKAKEAQ